MKTSLKLAEQRALCDHVTGYICRKDDPLVKLVLSSELPSINQRADQLMGQGFSLTVFPWCCVCGQKLLAGSYRAKEPVNGRIVK